MYPKTCERLLQLPQDQMILVLSCIIYLPEWATPIPQAAFCLNAPKLSIHRNQVWMLCYHFLGWLVLFLYLCQAGWSWRMWCVAAFLPCWWLCLGIHLVSVHAKGIVLLFKYLGHTCIWFWGRIFWRWYQSQLDQISCFYLWYFVKILFFIDVFPL